MSIAKYTFEADFRQGGPGRRQTDMEVAEAREAGFREGLARGRAEAEAQANAALQHMAGLIAQQAQTLLETQDRRWDEVEIAAAALATKLARRIGGAALAQTPLAPIEQAARECIAQARSAPHLAVKVAADMADQAEAMFGRLAHESGYAGRVVVLPDEMMRPGDALIEWADGGAVIDRDGLDATIEAAAARALGAPPDQILN